MVKIAQCLNIFISCVADDWHSYGDGDRDDDHDAGGGRKSEVCTLDIV